MDKHVVIGLAAFCAGVFAWSMIGTIGTKKSSEHITFATTDSNPLTISTKHVVGVKLDGCKVIVYTVAQPTHVINYETNDEAAGAYNTIKECMNHVDD